MRFLIRLPTRVYSDCDIMSLNSTVWMPKFGNMTDRQWEELLGAIRDVADRTMGSYIHDLKLEILDTLRKEIDQRLESRLLYEVTNIKDTLHEMNQILNAMRND